MNKLTNLVRKEDFIFIFPLSSEIFANHKIDYKESELFKTVFKKAIYNNFQNCTKFIKIRKTIRHYWHDGVKNPVFNQSKINQMVLRQWQMKDLNEVDSNLGLACVLDVLNKYDFHGHAAS